VDPLSHDPPPKPTIAILTIKDGSRIFRGDRNNFKDIIRKGSELGADVYVVTASDLKLTALKVPGFRYNFEKKKWNRELVPVPEVIYNRIPYRKQEMQPEVQQTIQVCIRSNQVSLYNPSFFNKWSLFEWLSNSKLTKKYIPVTQQLSSSENLVGLLRQYPVVYLKPVKGKAGKGIMRLEKNVNNNKTTYRLITQDYNILTYKVHETINSLWKDISERCGTKEYIMQQGISLANFKQRAYDLRALIQKNSKGAWGVTGIGARVAGKLSITTHVPRGGSIDNPRKLLTDAFGKQLASRIFKRTKVATLQLARQIERSSGHQLGEMSMDLGIDTSGRIWFFEANSKPMKFDEPEIRQKSLERTIHYGLYLNKKAKRR
jgi:hypothetical protein